jgi:hypothetical protein
MSGFFRKEITDRKAKALRPPGSARLDDPDYLARNHIRFQPVVLRSLLGVGYRRLGDLRWVPSRELMASVSNGLSRSVR